MNANTALAAIYNEFNRANTKHGPLNSHHEAYAVIAEEFNKEYWEEVCKGGSTPRDLEGLKTELVQTAAMCLKALVNLC